MGNNCYNPNPCGRKKRQAGEEDVDTKLFGLFGNNNVPNCGGFNQNQGGFNQGGFNQIKGASTKDQTRLGVNANALTDMERQTKASKRQSVKGVKMELGNTGVILPATAIAVMQNHLDNILTTPGLTKLVLKIMESNFKTLVHMKQLIEI